MEITSTDLRGPAEAFVSRAMINAINANSLDGHIDTSNLREVQTPDMGSGLVCISCGNRGINRPFLMMSENRAKVFAVNGNLRIVVSEEDDKKVMELKIKGEEVFYDDTYSGIIFTDSNPNMVICGNCGGPVVSAAKAMRHCENMGCTGCLVCGNPFPHEEVLRECALCLGNYYNDHGTEINSDFRSRCYDLRCENLFMSEKIYRINANDIHDEITDIYS